MKQLLTGMKPAIGWLLVVTLLLVLPGQALPQETWLSKIQFDKIVHVGLFAVLTWLFCRGWYQNGITQERLKRIFIYITLAAALYGLAMEFIQKYCVPFRSFDVYDVIADAGGAFAGYFFSRWLYLNVSSKNWQDVG